MSDAPFTVLLVDDEEEILFSCSALLRTSGFDRVLTEQDSRNVLPLLGREAVSVIILDLNMPHVSGFDLLRDIHRDYPDIPVVIVTAANEVDMAISCMKAGAVDYFVKPVEQHRLIASIRRAWETSALSREVTELKRSLLSGRLRNEAAFSGILTRSADMVAIFRYLEAVGPGTQPVAICGETGTGKELLARAVHDVSGRKGKFVPVNVAGLDDHVFTDTLFGHIRGAFTGADARREGLVAQAAGGTLFLDEIGDLAESSQVKLLRLLQEGEYYSLGADTPQKSRARIVVATNRNLPDMVRSGKFRQDLFYRLCAHQVEIPPLSRRREDIMPMIDRFLAEAAAELGKRKPTVPPELESYLRLYDFPGNVRELKALVYDAVARHERGVLSLEVFQRVIGKSREAEPAAPPSDRLMSFTDPDRIPTLKAAEEFLIARALQLAGGNQGIAAAHLGITRQGLNKKLNRHR